MAGHSLPSCSTLFLSLLPSSCCHPLFPRCSRSMCSMHIYLHSVLLELLPSLLIPTCRAHNFFNLTHARASFVFPVSFLRHFPDVLHRISQAVHIFHLPSPIAFLIFRVAITPPPTPPPTSWLRGGGGGVAGRGSGRGLLLCRQDRVTGGRCAMREALVGDRKSQIGFC
jgi:hypothetical protein